MASFLRFGSVVSTRWIAGLALITATVAVAPLRGNAAPMASASRTPAMGQDAFRYRLGPGDKLAMSVFKMAAS